MRILALDTSTDLCGAALLAGDACFARELMAPRAHAELILPMVEAVLAEAGCTLGSVDAIAFGRGPGSFTGVRIAASVVQGLALGAGLPVVPVSDLAALARHAWRVHGATRVCAALDARMDEVYAAAFVVDALGAVNAQGEERVIAPTQLEVPAGDGWFGVGSGWTAHGPALRARFGALATGSDATLQPSAVDVAALGAMAYATGGGLPARSAMPVYLRDRVAEPAAPPRSGR